MPRTPSEWYRVSDGFYAERGGLRVIRRVTKDMHPGVAGHQEPGWHLWELTGATWVEGTGFRGQPGLAGHTMAHRAGPFVTLEGAKLAALS